MSQAAHQMERSRTSSTAVPVDGGGSVGYTALSRLSVRELIGELARVEDTLRMRPALIARHDALIPNPARRRLLDRANAIVGELAVRRCR